MRQAFRNRVRIAEGKAPRIIMRIACRSTQGLNRNDSYSVHGKVWLTKSTVHVELRTAQEPPAPELSARAARTELTASRASAKVVTKNALPPASRIKP